MADSLCDECRAQYAEVKRQLDLRGVAYKENWRLVRGLDYYMRTTFEITAKGLGSQNAVCGGGRYDGLVELLGGLPTKGIGFAIGEDRLILVAAGSEERSWRAAKRRVGRLRCVHCVDGEECGGGGDWGGAEVASGGVSGGVASGGAEVWEGAGAGG